MVHGGTRLTWWGHACVAITDPGADGRSTTVLTDPVLTDRVAHLRRRRGPRPHPVADGVDAVLISHLHADHLHVPSLRRLPRGIPVLVPRGAAEQVRGLTSTGHRLVEVSPGETVAVGGLTVDVVPAAHDGRRLPRGPQRSPALGYVLRGRRSTYFTGDTALVPEMADWAGGVDVAVLPVGGWGPSLGPGHLDPQSAARAAELLAPGLAVPVHFGTLWPVGAGRLRPDLFLPPGADFVAAAAARGVRAVELAPGESLDLDAALR